MTPVQMAKHLTKTLPKSWWRFLNMRMIEHRDNTVPEEFKCYDLKFWETVFELLN